MCLAHEDNLVILHIKNKYIIKTQNCNIRLKSFKHLSFATSLSKSSSPYANNYKQLIISQNSQSPTTLESNTKVHTCQASKQ
ncbi:hypothetical protein HanRHA438_Chr14g0667481 [Helianthus annuus]|uniref:Uncharacterized protein n=1 Tax=Helianthus annuus TaxID=4232 RepID=A0A9K3EAS8_HELAN|nr:hypothetical protein HanXRQr2_Chr14g0656551 [Helianthus annuus]KAJ0850693.1 hypothetical protein HanPSC8_Chr13g0583791 [Helianthus annuus]KAJ0854887.1 hypothetical protein HanRHA438_Chr14g0667481 [Helianthus annuus]